MVYHLSSIARWEKLTLSVFKANGRTHEYFCTAALEDFQRGVYRHTKSLDLWHSFSADDHVFVAWEAIYVQRQRHGA